MVWNFVYFYMAGKLVSHPDCAGSRADFGRDPAENDRKEAGLGDPSCWHYKGGQKWRISWENHVF